ncbi:unnamed protein product [Caenorhabditis angaria]|uniref:Uncharacterized protein n=1 Tax=Caenorhabditis angaria TaxID=860376 RepID=A0A9P1N4Z9_9PELO|nr:unnamed protein product [Caenorhabditis angaria]
MGLLKEDLKTAKGLLKDGKNEEVVELLEEHIKNGVQDYFLFIFSGLANSNSENYVDGYQMYRKAVILDDSKGDAWKGLYKLIEGDGKVKAEQFDLEICEKMKTFVPDKISEIEKTSHRILFQLRDWKNLSSLDFSSDFAPKIINLLAPKIIKLEDSEREIVAKSFNLIEETFENDLELVAIYCKFVQGDQRIPTLVKFYSKLPEPWILAELSIFVYEQYFETGKFPDFSGIFENPLIAHLQSQNITEALQIVDKLPAEAKVIYPEALLYVELLAESENWAQCETTVRSILNNTKNENVKSTCFNWISRIVLESDQDIKKLSSLPLKRPKFFIEEVKTSLIQGIPVKTNDKKEELLVKLLSALYNKNVTENEKNIVESFLKLPELDWKDLLLAAEIKLALEIDATTLLVKAAKLNPRSSRVFFVLGKSLITKNPTKSRACLERAVKIQPGNEEYVKQLDDVLISQNATATERLVHLNKLVQIRENRRKSAWLTDVLSVLYLETNNYDLAIEELQHMVRLYQDNKLAWARLANAYFKKGHLRASVSSYEHLAELENGHRYTIPMIRVLIQLREFETSLEKILEYREKFGNSEEDESCRIALDTLEAQIRLNLMNDTFGEERRTHLRESLKVLNRSLSSEESSNYSIVYKLIGDSLLKVSEYQTRFYDFFEMNPNWKVVDQLSCIKLSVTFYSVVLKLRKDDALAWHDFSVSIMRQYKIEKNPELLTKSNSFIKHAIKLTKDESLLSTLWTLLAENLRLSDEPANRILHCLTRALQLNKINDVAWLELAILCLANGDMENSSRCLEQAIKYNPHNGEAWCTWAQHAHLQGAAYDATVMYRQALCIKPTPSSINGYAVYICESLQKQNCRFDCAGTALDFQPVADLCEKAISDKTTLYHLAMIADLFGYYREAFECFQMAEIEGDVMERAKMKLKLLDETFDVELKPVSPANLRLATMLPYSAPQLLSNVKNISVPLFVSATIALKINLPIDCIATIHDALPRHELIDYFPTILPEGMDNGLRHLEKDGEIPFRYRNHVAQELFEELKQLRENYEASLEPKKPEK